MSDECGMLVENYRRFLKRVIETQRVWILRDAEGYAWCESEDDDRVVLLFFSERANAERLMKSQFAGYEAVEIPLAEFLQKWLPQMGEDGAYAGPDYPENLDGMEIDPDDLNDEIINEMPRELFDAYAEK